MAADPTLGTTKRGGRPVPDTWYTSCEFCGHVFQAKLGRYGCPNCEGQGLEEPALKGHQLWDHPDHWEEEQEDAQERFWIGALFAAGVIALAIFMAAFLGLL